MQTGSLKPDAPVRALSWNLEGTRLLTAGSLLQLWHLKPHVPEPDKPVTFTLGGEAHSESTENHEEAEKSQGW